MDDAVFLRVFGGDKTPLWDACGVGQRIVEARPSRGAPVRRTGPIPNPAAIAKFAQTDFVCVELIPSKPWTNEAAESVDRWVSGLLEPHWRGPCINWLRPGEEGDRHPIWQTFLREGARGVRGRLLVGDANGFRLVRFASYSTGHATLTVWDRMPGWGDFKQLHFDVSDLIGTARGKSLAPWAVLHSAYANAMISLLAEDLERQRNRIENLQINLLEGLSRVPATGSEPISKTVAQSLARAAKDLRTSHLTLSAIRGASTKIDDVESAKVSELQRLTLVSLSDFELSLQATQRDLRETYDLYTTAVGAEEESRSRRFQSTLSVLVAVLGVPTLIAGVFGTNVKFAGEDQVSGFWAMCLWMAAGVGLAWMGTRRLANDRLVPAPERIRRAVVLGALLSGLAAIGFAAKSFDDWSGNLGFALLIFALTAFIFAQLAEREGKA